MRTRSGEACQDRYLDQSEDESEWHRLSAPRPIRDHGDMAGGIFISTGTFLKSDLAATGEL